LVFLSSIAANDSRFFLSFIPYPLSFCFLLLPVANRLGQLKFQNRISAVSTITSSAFFNPKSKIGNLK